MKLFAILAIFFTAQAHAITEKTVRVGVTTGFPNLIAAELAYVRMEPFALGISFGGFPVQGIISSAVPLSTIPLSITSANTYTMSPSATYFLNGMELFLNYYPWKGAFFVRVSYGNLAFQANGAGRLNNVTAGTSLANAITVTANVNQPMVSTKVGWDWPIGDHLSLGTGIGIAYLLTATNSISTGGSASAAAVVAPDADAAFQSAKDSMTNSFNQGVAQLNALSRILPSAFVNIGYSF